MVFDFAESVPFKIVEALEYEFVDIEVPDPSDDDSAELELSEELESQSTAFLLATKSFPIPLVLALLFLALVFKGSAVFFLLLGFDFDGNFWDGWLGFCSSFVESCLEFSFDVLLDLHFVTAELVDANEVSSLAVFLDLILDG